MNFLSILILSVGLSMDAAAVSAARGLATPHIRARHLLLVAGFFGGFQALMPLAGWLVGTQLGPWIGAYDHWIAFTLLGLLGAKMLWEARSAGEEQGPEIVDQAKDLYGLGAMLVLAVATSIDALAVGVTLPMLGAPLLTSLFTIGLTTAALSMAGLYAGKHLGAMLGRRLDVVGGVVLIGLGTKILIEHLGSGI